MDVYVADRFGGWQAKVLACLERLFDPASASFPADAMQQVLATLSSDPDLAAMNQKALKQTGAPPVLPFLPCYFLSFFFALSLARHPPALFLASGPAAALLLHPGLLTAPPTHAGSHACCSVATPAPTHIHVLTHCPSPPPPSLLLPAPCSLLLQ